MGFLKTREQCSGYWKNNYQSSTSASLSNHW